MDVEQRGDAHPLIRVLAEHQPRTATEAAELARIRSLAREPAALSRSTPLHITASALVVHPSTGQVLLRWHPRQRGWLQVGGHPDEGETDPLAVALREAIEETGLDDVTPWPDGRLLHVVIVPVPASPSEPAHEHADLRFVLRTEQPRAARPENPEAALRWVEISEAREVVREENLRETLSRIEELFAVVR
ncbi:MAG: NUDIX hydrolase [Jatrophihabitantaceae bacterium]